MVVVFCVFDLRLPVDDTHLLYLGNSSSVFLSFLLFVAFEEH